MRRPHTAKILGAALATALVGAAPLAATPIETNTCWNGVKIEDPADGAYDVSFGGRSGTIVLDVDESDNTFDFTASGSLSLWMSVVVKGGPGALTYEYDPAVSGAADLHAPVNETNGQYPGLSHVCFYPAPEGDGGGGGDE